MAAEGRSFVVESIVHSKGCLNAITIVEGQEWSGETGAPQPGGSPVSLFGGAMHGSLFEDCGDSSDYFCGVSRRGGGELVGSTLLAFRARSCSFFLRQNFNVPQTGKITGIIFLGYLSNTYLVCGCVCVFGFRAQNGPFRTPCADPPNCTQR